MSSASHWSPATLRRAAEIYVDYQRRISAAATADERVTLRNALLADPLASIVHQLYA